jgi:recombination protein U
MATWNSRGLRGSSLEELINYTNEYYREKKLAVVQKIPTPIKPIRMDKDSSQITLAYFEKDSTVSYRAFRYASMRRNVRLIRFLYRIYMSISIIL